MSGIAVSLGSLDKKTNITASTHTHLNLFLTLSHSLFPVFISRTYIRFTHTDNELCYCKACSSSPPQDHESDGSFNLFCSTDEKKTTSIIPTILLLLCIVCNDHYIPSMEMGGWQKEEEK